MYKKIDIDDVIRDDDGENLLLHIKQQSAYLYLLRSYTNFFLVATQQKNGLPITELKLDNIKNKTT